MHCIGGARIWLKREDLNHTGAHKINNAVGQALIAKRLGKKRLIAETGAGQHGVATATVCAYMGLELTVCDVCHSACSADGYSKCGLQTLCLTTVRLGVYGSGGCGATGA